VHGILRATTLLALASTAAACSDNAQIIAYVIAPDGGDPFLGDDAATEARITLENDAGTSTTVPVMANGSFQMDLRPTSETEVSRLRIEALRGGEVIATGVTTPVQWSAQAHQVIPVLMQFPDSVTAAPHALADGRADCQPVVLGSFGEFVGCFTAPRAGDASLAPAVYELMHQGLATNFAQTMPGQFTGDATVLIAGDKIYVVQGDRAVQYIGNPMINPVAQDVSMWLPHDASGQRSLRAGIVRSSVYHSTAGGWLIGGNIAGAPQTRVDHFAPISDGSASNSTIINFDGTANPLLVGRSAPTIIRLNVDDTNPRLLIAGGNAPDAAFAETYRPLFQDSNVTVQLGPDTNRTHAAIACIHVSEENQGCTHAIVLGGHNGAAVGDDLVLALGTGASNPPSIVQRGHWLNHPRDDAHLALAEGGRLVVAGGTDANGQPVTDIEALDVHDPMAPPTSRDVAHDTCANPMVAGIMEGITNGTVVIMGGIRDGAACTDIAFYRH
jgi:hypothetical protein